MAYIAVKSPPSYMIAAVKATQGEVNAYVSANPGHTAIIGDIDIGTADASGSYFYYNNAVHNSPPAVAANTRKERRATLYRAIALNMVRLPAVFAKDAAEVSRIHALITKIVACAGVDAIIDSAAARGHLTTAAEYDFRQYIKDWKRASNPTGTAWDGYLTAEDEPGFPQFATPNAATGAPELQSAVSVPSGWDSQEFETKVYDYLP